MGHGDGARPRQFFHLLSDRWKRRRIQDLQQVVSKELAAPYNAKYLPDTAQKVLSLETRVTLIVDPDPSMEERLVMAVWQIG